MANAPALYTLCKRKEGSNPPHPAPSVPSKGSTYNSEETTGAGSGVASAQYELQSGLAFKASGYSEAERSRTDSARDSHAGILVTSNIDTEYSSRD